MINISKNDFNCTKITSTNGFTSKNLNNPSWFTWRKVQERTTLLEQILLPLVGLPE